MLSPVLNGDAVVQIIGSRRDITEKQQAIAELQESEERYSYSRDKIKTLNIHEMNTLSREGGNGKGA
jgi:hypothetical protein